MNIESIYNLTHCPICNNKLIKTTNEYASNYRCTREPIKHDFYYYQNPHKNYILIKLNNLIRIVINNNQITTFYMQNINNSLNHNLFYLMF